MKFLPGLSVRFRSTETTLKNGRARPSNQLQWFSARLYLISLTELLDSSSLSLEFYFISFCLFAESVSDKWEIQIGHFQVSQPSVIIISYLFLFFLTFHLLLFLISSQRVFQINRNCSSIVFKLVTSTIFRYT